MSLIVSGPGGRMGRSILRLALADEEINVIGALVSPRHSESGAVPLAAESQIPTATNLSEIPDAAGGVLIEFTNPDATLQHAQEAAEIGCKMVIGTTGLDEPQRQALNDAANRTAIVVGSNMSIGVNALLGIVGRMAGALDRFDIEIVEMHHRMKKDAPSGTALAFAEEAARARDLRLPDAAIYGRQGVAGERPSEQIGIHALRGGDVIGEHTVIFASEGERIELTHRATSRDVFATGAIRAAKFVVRKRTGLFSMRDVLGI